MCSVVYNWRLCKNARLYPEYWLHTHIPLQLSADNYQLREELRQEVHHHELVRKSIEGEARQLELKISGASVRMRAVQRAVEDWSKMDRKSLKTIPCKNFI